FYLIPVVLPLLLLYPLLLRPTFLTGPKAPPTLDHRERVLVCAVYLLIDAAICGLLVISFPLLLLFAPEYLKPEDRQVLPFVLTFFLSVLLLLLLLGIGLLRFRRWGWVLTVELCGLAILVCCVLPVGAFYVRDPLKLLEVAAFWAYF